MWGVAICQYIKELVFAHKDIAQPTSGSCSQILPSLGQTPTEIYGHKEQAKQKEQANKFLKSQLFIHSRCMTVDVSENLGRIESTILLSFKKKKRTRRSWQKRICVCVRRSYFSSHGINLGNSLGFTCFFSSHLSSQIITCKAQLSSYLLWESFPNYSCFFPTLNYST